MIDTFPLILQLDATSGNPMRWITYQDSSYYMCKNLVSYELGAVEFDLHGGTNALTGLQSKLRINTIVAIKSKPHGKFVREDRIPLTNRTLFRRDWNICAYCATELPTTKLTRDHVNPKAKGGVNRWENVVTACGTCNKRKDNRTPEQAGMQLVYIPYKPNRHELLILMNRNIISCQMEFLIKGVPTHSRIHENAGRIIALAQ